MSLRATCQGCGKVYNISDRLAGKTVSCKACGEPIEIPDASGEAEEYAAAPLQLSARPTRASSGGGKPSRPAVPSKSPWAKIALIGGGAVLVAFLCCGGVFWKVSSGLQKTDVYPNQPDFGAATSPFPVSRIPVPQFPELGPAKTLPSGVTVHYVDLRSIPSNQGAAGTQMAMRVYLPPGDHAPKSLACMLVAPAGTNLLEGSEMDDDDYHDETLPYAEAGMAVVFYGIDGAAGAENGDAGVRQGYLKFRAACAGVVNGRNALEFALARLPQVDPRRISSAGHSSAATLSLLLAAHEPRLRSCVAYAPASDVELRLKEAIDMPGVGLLFPGVKEFVKQSSPTTHAAQIRCPVFLFHARDDSNIPYADSVRFADLLRTNGKSVTFSDSPTGDHYDSMISDGIPRAVEWLEK